MSYVVGIDLGTTSTVAAVCRPGGTAQVVPLEGAAGAVPSAVYLGADGTFLVGEAAQRRALSDPGHVVRDLTRRIGDATPVLVGRRPVSPDELAARFLARLVDDVARREGGVAARVAVTHPAVLRAAPVGRAARRAGRAGARVGDARTGAGGRGDRLRRRRAGRAGGDPRRLRPRRWPVRRDGAPPRARRILDRGRPRWRRAVRRYGPRRGGARAHPRGARPGLGGPRRRPTRTCSPRSPTCAARPPRPRKPSPTTPRCSSRWCCPACAPRCGSGARSSRR